MTDYTKMVEALNRLWQVQDNDLEDWVYGSQQAMHDAADVIEDLQAEVKRLELDNEDYEHENRRLHGEIEALQAELDKYHELCDVGEIPEIIEIIMTV